MRLSFLKPFIPLIIIIILFVVTAKFGLGKISEIRIKVAQAQKNERVLNQKISVLNEVEAGISDNSSVTAIALPGSNPSLITAYQIKVEAASAGLTPFDIKSGAGIEDKSGLSRVDVSFDIEGSRAFVFDFLKKVETFAPITMVEKVKLNEIGGAARAQVTVKTYFAEFPKKLPAVTDAINELTADEGEILTDVLGLRQLPFINLLPFSSNERVDPFSH